MLDDSRSHGTISTGKIGELHVFRELLRRGVNPYIPLVDVEGIDALIRRPDGTFMELQVKTVNTPKGPRWFMVQGLRERPTYYIVCVSLVTDPIETWIVPAHAFRRHATYSPKTDAYDLNLDSTARGESVPRGKLLEAYKEAWHLLVGEAELRPIVSEHRRMD